MDIEKRGDIAVPFSSRRDAQVGNLCHRPKPILQAHIRGTTTISAAPNTSTASQQREYRRYLLLCAAIIVLALVLKLPSLRSPRLEGDELIYWHLTQNWLENGAYSLQGTPILKALPPSIYDKPLFHHPPLLSLLMLDRKSVV